MSKTPQSLDVGKMALEGFGQVMESMDFFKRAWATFNLPTPFTPTLDVEELDKRIADLRAVEQWLSLNQSMLRNTIQGLEIQRGTIQAVRTMSDSFGKALKPDDDATAQTLARFAAAAAQNAASPFPGAPSAATSRSGFSDAGEADQTGEADEPDGADEADEADKAGVPDKPEKVAVTDTADAPGAAHGGQEDLLRAAGINPLAWWNLLQSNFQQIAQAAASGAGSAPAAGVAPGSATDAGTARDAKDANSTKGARAKGRTKGLGGAKAKGGKSAKAGTGRAARPGGSKARTPGAPS